MEQMTQVISNSKLPFMQIHFRFSLYFRASLVWLVMVYSIQHNDVSQLIMLQQETTAPTLAL